MDVEAEDLPVEVSEASGTHGEDLSQAQEDELLSEEVDDHLMSSTGPATPHLSTAITALRVSEQEEGEQDPSPEGEGE